MDEILNDLGLSDGFTIPISNDENQALQLEIQKKQNEKNALEFDYESCSDRFNNLSRFIESSRNELAENQKLITAYDNQINSEDADVRLLKGHTRSCEAEQKSALKTIQESKVNEEYLKNENNRALSRIEKLKTYLHWDRAALEAYQDDVARILSDAALLEKFAKQDQFELKDLELQRAKLRNEVEAKRNKMEHLKDEVITLEQSLEKIGLVFQQQHEDRNALVGQWEGSVRILTRRDEDIHRAIEELGGLRVQAKQRMRDLTEYKTFYENEVKNRKEKEADLYRITKESINGKELATQLSSAVSDMHGEYLTLRCSLSRAAHLLQDTRTNCRRMAEEILKKRQLCLKYQQHLQNLRQEIRNSRGKNISATERLQQLNELEGNEQRLREKLANEKSKLLEIIRGINEELGRLKENDKSQKASMTGLECNLHAIRKRTQAAIEEQKRQMDILYSAEMALMEKEIRYRKMLGFEDSEDKEEKEKKLSSLKAAMLEVQSAHDLISKECCRLDQEFRRLTTAMIQCEKDVNYYRTKKQEGTLVSEAGEKELQFLRTKNQERQVDDNVLKLRVRQLEKAVNRVGGKLFTLEKQRLELDEAVKERNMEVEAVMDVLLVQKRGMAEQVSSLHAKINVAKLKVDHLRKKYDVSICSLGPNDSGETQSVAYYKLKAAQERCELQQIGDRLDDRIRKTEKEIQAMENTLKVVNCANRSYKFTLSQVEADGPEMVEKENLEATYLEAIDNLRRKKAMLQVLNESATNLEDELKSQVELEVKVMKNWKDKDVEAASLDKELMEQEAKLNRAAKLLRGFIRNVRSAQHTRHQTLEEKDIELREILEQNQVSLQQLSEIVARTIETGPVVTRYLQEKGLHLPQVLSSHLTSSRRSTASSRSSGSLPRSCFTIDSSALGDREAELLSKQNIRKTTLRSERKLQKSVHLQKGPPTVDLADVFQEAK